jgi:hypothetical protein
MEKVPSLSAVSLSALEPINSAMLGMPVLTWHFPGDTEENHKNLSQNTQSPGRHFSPGPPKYEAEVLTTRSNHSVTVIQTGQRQNMN